jgi:hypothetical protein
MCLGEVEGPLALQGFATDKPLAKLMTSVKGVGEIAKKS